MNIRLLFALVLCSLAFAASAQTVVGLHTVSIHAPDHGENNSNWGAYVQHKRWVLGGYRNSIGRDTAYLGYVKPLGYGFDVMGGLASGYDRRCETYTVTAGQAKHKTAKPVTETRERCSGFSRHALTPALAVGYTAPFAVLGASPRIVVVPGFKDSSTVASFLLQWSIK
jgi:hypothetical protein